MSCDREPVGGGRLTNLCLHEIPSDHSIKSRRGGAMEITGLDGLPGSYREGGREASKAATSIKRQMCSGKGMIGRVNRRANATVFPGGEY